MVGSSRISGLLGGAALVAAAAFTTAPMATAGTPIEVVMNEAKIVKLARAADTIVIGNPAIADAAVQDANTIVLTGKGFGTTNIVVLDTTGEPIVDERIVVKRSDDATMRIYRRGNVLTLSCTPICQKAYQSEAESMADAASD